MHQKRRVAWLGTSTSHPCGGRAKCSSPAGALSASKNQNKMWNCDFMYKWRGRLLTAKRAISPSDAESKQGLLFITRFIYSQTD